MASTDTLSNKDYMSTWLQNKHFLSQINDDMLHNLQNDVINNVFGGFGKLLKLLLKHYDDKFMTHKQQLKLNNILSNVQPTDTITTPKNKWSLLLLPDDCIINAMKFMDFNTKLVLQYSCRTLSLITRKPIVCSKPKELQYIGGNTHHIAALILSNNNKDHMNAIEWILNNVSITYTNPNRFIRKFYATCPMLQKILSSHIGIAQKLATILNENITKEQVQRCVKFLVCYNDFIYRIFPSITYMLTSLNTTDKLKKQVFGYICLPGRLKDEIFMFNIMQKKNGLLLQAILNYDAKNTDKIISKILKFGFVAHIKVILDNKAMLSNLNYVSDILKAFEKEIKKEYYEEIIDYIINNSLLMNALMDKIKKDQKIEIGCKLKVKVRGYWYDSEIKAIKDDNKQIQMWYEKFGKPCKEWMDLTKENDCKRLKLPYLQIVALVFKYANHKQRVQIIQKGYFQSIDIYSRFIIVAGVNDEKLQIAFENCIKRWKIMNKYLSIFVDKNTVNVFREYIYDIQYNFEDILKDINGYEGNKSVIISFMREKLNWNKMISDSFYVHLKLILIVEVLDFNDKYIERCILDMIGKYYNQNNISKMPFIASTKYFNIINKLGNKIKKKVSNNKINNAQNISKEKLNAILFDKILYGEPNHKIRNGKSKIESKEGIPLEQRMVFADKHCKYKQYNNGLNRIGMRKVQKSQFKGKYKNNKYNKMQFKQSNSNKNGKLRYKYHRKRW